MCSNATSFKILPNVILYILSDLGIKILIVRRKRNKEKHVGTKTL